MNLLATNYFIATEAELPEIYAVYLEKLAEINANPGVTIVLLSDTEEPAEHQSVLAGRSWSFTNWIPSSSLMG